MIPELIPKEALQDKLDAIQNIIPNKQWWYFQLEGIQNFIYHLDNIPSERTKARTAKSIEDYLNLLGEKILQEQDRRALAKELTPYFWQISNVYRDELGFINKPVYPFLLIALTILYFILNHYSSSLFAFVTVSAIGLLRIVYTQIKIKARKVC
ncbi:MAG TPA: hypothetical protein VD794_13940 [Flavisolibacter sp.]|nr:hypothetical protein [Flavisolibacter sp.]